MSKFSQSIPVVPAVPEGERLSGLYDHMNRSFGLSESEISVVRAPLRICPVGAHIDHQLGVVTGMTINESVLLAFAPTNDGTVRIQSSQFDTEVSFQLDHVPPFEAGDWGNYIRGAVIALRDQYELTNGIVGYVESRMPTGGLSSSAAVTVAYLLALQAVNGLHVSPHQNIQLVSKTEQEYIGLKNGILDQTSILFSQPDSLTRIDCQDEEISLIDAGSEMDAFDIMIVYSGVGKNLVGAGYNSRVAECQQAASSLLKIAGRTTDNPRLRLVAPDLFDAENHRLDEVPRKRAAHYFGEMARVTRAVNAWQEGNIRRFGEVMNQSGDSSVHLYESGCPQLITLYESLRSIPGVLGTRFSGAGFRGNCIAFVQPDAASSIAEELHKIYPVTHPEIAELYSIHFCQTAGPAAIL